MDKVLNFIKVAFKFLSSVLSVIGKIPVFLLPPKLKGYRTELFNMIGVVIVALEGFDITGMCESVAAIININCNTVQEIFALLMLMGNLDLRKKTDTKVYQD